MANALKLAGNTWFGSDTSTGYDPVPSPRAGQSGLDNVVEFPLPFTASRAAQPSSSPEAQISLARSGAAGGGLSGDDGDGNGDGDGQPVTIEGHPVRAAVMLGDDSSSQVAATIDCMGGMALASSRHPVIAELASRFPADPLSYIHAVFNWIKSSITFRHDQSAIAVWKGKPVAEVLTWPTDLAWAALNGDRERARGDCDDFATLAAALMMARGIPVCFCTAAVDRQAPVMSHVYTVVEVGGQRMAFDASHGDRPGWEVPDVWEAVTPRVQWPIVGSAPVGVVAVSSPALSTDDRLQTNLIILATVVIMAWVAWKAWKGWNRMGGDEEDAVARYGYDEEDEEEEED